MVFAPHKTCAGVVEWQTRSTQNRVSERTCRFESGHRHQLAAGSQQGWLPTFVLKRQEPHCFPSNACYGKIAKGVQAISQIREDQLEALLVHAFIDLIQERKLRGRQGLTATMETIATWLTDRTALPITPQHVQALTLALRDAHIIDVGGGGIGRPNFYDTREEAMGIDAFWDQIEAFLMVWRLPNRKKLLDPGA